MYNVSAIRELYPRITYDKWKPVWYLHVRRWNVRSCRTPLKKIYKLSGPGVLGYGTDCSAGTSDTNTIRDPGSLEYLSSIPYHTGSIQYWVIRMSWRHIRTSKAQISGANNISLYWALPSSKISHVEDEIHDSVETMLIPHAMFPQHGHDLQRLHTSDSVNQSIACPSNRRSVDRNCSKMSIAIWSPSRLSWK